MSDEVVALGAWCDVRPADRWSAGSDSVSFDVAEFALLADGRRITLHHGERGFTVSGPRPSSGHRPPDPLGALSAEDIESGVLNTVLPDDDDTGEDHPYEWLRELLRRQGVAVSADALRSVPYLVELSERLQHLLATRPDPGPAGG